MGEDLTVVKYANSDHGKRDSIYTGLFQGTEQGLLAGSYKTMDLAQHKAD